MQVNRLATTINQVKPRMMRGFTLIELMFTIVILAILITIAIPNFSDAMLSSKLTSLANDLVASSNLARNEAIKRNSPVTMCVSTDGSTCTSGSWENGWIVIQIGKDVIQQKQAASNNLKMVEAGGIDTLTFQPTGVGTTQATVTVCRDNSDPGHQERVVTIDATGRTYVEKTTTGTCP